jgi:hypothetical protein
MTQRLASTTMTTATPPAGFLHLVVGYDVLSPGAITEVEEDFDEIEQELRPRPPGGWTPAGAPGSSSDPRASSPIS